MLLALVEPAHNFENTYEDEEEGKRVVEASWVVICGDGIEERSEGGTEGSPEASKRKEDN